MAVKKPMKKDFDKEQMYSKIMPTFAGPTPKEPRSPKSPAAAAQPPGTDRDQGPRYLLRNYMEDIVLEKIGHTMDMLKACTCEKCKKNVMAMTLNELPPAYMAVEADQVENAVRQLRAGVEVKVSAALIKAVQTVKAAPHD